MGRPKITSIGFAVPPISYTQEEVWRGLAYQPTRINLHMLFDPEKCKIGKRHFWIDLAKAKDMAWQELQDEYFRGAMELSKASVNACMGESGFLDIGCVTFVSCTGYQCPSITHHLAKELGFPSNVHYTNILGMGCEGGFPGLKRAYDYTITSGRSALVIATELSSCCFYPEADDVVDMENDYELARAKALFADASVSLTVGYDHDSHHPYILDFETYCDPQYINHLGFTWRNGRWRVLLSKKVKDIAPEVVGPAVKSLLKRNALTLNDIRWFVIHAGGSSVLDNLERRLDLPPGATDLSRKVLWEYGNCSSTTIGIIGKKLMNEDIIPGDYVLVLSVGPGMVGGATLLQFPGEEN